MIVKEIFGPYLSIMAHLQTHFLELMRSLCQIWKFVFLHTWISFFIVTFYTDFHKNWCSWIAVLLNSHPVHFAVNYSSQTDRPLVAASLRLGSTGLSSDDQSTHLLRFDFLRIDHWMQQKLWNPGNERISNSCIVKRAKRMSMLNEFFVLCRFLLKPVICGLLQKPKTSASIKVT